jgi:hypothetical protein
MAFNNRLSGYQHNSKTIFCSVYDSSNNIMDLTDYTGIFYLKSVVIGSLISLEKVGTKDASALSLTFDLTPSDTSLFAADYVYNIDISSNTKRITVVADKFSVLDNIRY